MKLTLAIIFFIFLSACSSNEKKSNQAELEAPKIEQLSEAELTEMSSYVVLLETIVMSTMGQESNFDHGTISFLDTVVVSFGENLNDAMKRSIGAYLGESLIRTYGGKWVKTQYGIGVEINDSLLAFPFERINKVHNNPEEYNLAGYFDAFSDHI